MSTQQTAVSPGKANLALATLFLAMFVMVSGELLVVGVLDRIAADLKVTIPAAGTLVTAYALGLALGGPILTALTIKLDKKVVLLGTLLLFAASNVAMTMTTSYGVFLGVRFFIGALAGLFIAVGFTAAVSVVPPERMGKAIGIVISGVAMAGALGVPLGTAVAPVIGWRGSFLAIAGVAVVVLIGAAALIPSVAASGGGVGHQAKYAFAPRVLAVLFLNFIVFATAFAAWTYIVPFLQDVTGISGSMLSVFLLAYGAATAVGSFGGGKFADWNAGRALIIGGIGMAVSLLALYFVGSVAFLVAIVLVALGLSHYGIVASLQVRVITLAGPGGQLAQSLPVSAANIGIAFGAFAGGIAIKNYSASAPVITGVILAVVTILVAWGSSYLKPPVVEESTATAQSVPEPA
ncbi:MFS transporter [Longispora fulva]|uniref:DHA1 family inner membrane transport protein n=1 Tax=Longispora fulva TaxID=619741 RepID=A0A8J7GJK8_9ACTN|nr:MFS transporter [Longispora fulva]MBG6138745.1 DHA1 family inner membrane transport protein [Longispora fulva]